MGDRAAYVVVDAGEEHLADLARMRTAWTVEQGGAPEEGFAARFRAWWASEEGHRLAWVAAVPAGPVVGMANLSVFERMPRPGRDAGRWAYVANVWVDPAHRRRGVATQLMRRVVERCRADGMSRIVLNPSEMSVPVYSALGFRPAHDLMRLDL
jgi:GNAT superfamily N-acetyltransferase